VLPAGGEVSVQAVLLQAVLDAGIPVAHVGAELALVVQAGCTRNSRRQGRRKQRSVLNATISHTVLGSRVLFDEVPGPGIRRCHSVNFLFVSMAHLALQ